MGICPSLPLFYVLICTSTHFLTNLALIISSIEYLGQDVYINTTHVFNIEPGEIQSQLKVSVRSENDFRS